MPKVKQTPCGHCPPKPNKARGMCNACYTRIIRDERRDSAGIVIRSSQKFTDADKALVAAARKMPVGNRIELWRWKHTYLDIGECTDNLLWRCADDVWAMEFKGKEITGAFGPMTDKFEWRRRCADNQYGSDGVIIRDSAVITTMERRRDEFTKIKRAAA